MKNIVVLFLFIFSLLSFKGVHAQSNDWQVIKLTNGVDVNEYIQNVGLRMDQVKIGSHGMLKIPAGYALTMASDQVISIENDAKAEVQATIPNDYFYDRNQWNLVKIGLEQVWDDYRGSDQVVVAMLDTGLNMDHEDMKGFAWTNEGETANNDKDDDGNGYVDDINGYNLIKESSNINDDNGHGTAVSSIIAAKTDNEVGIAGVNWRVSLMPVKVASASGTASLYDIAQGIYYAVDNGADVINMSLGSQTDREFLKEAVQYASDSGVLMVAASGNSSSSSANHYILYPASYDEVVAVGATEINDEVANLNNSTFISHYGNNLDLVAPGVDILTADGENDDGYLVYDGTSMASPHVAGVAALMLSKNPNLTAGEIRQILIDTASNPEPMSGEFDQKYGNGLLNAESALQAVQIDVGDDDDDGPDYPMGDDEYTYSSELVRVSNDWYLRPFEQREVEIVYKNVGDGWWPIRGDEVVRLGTSNQLDRVSSFYDASTWLTTNRISSYNTEKVGFGDEIKFKFNVVAPGTQGEYNECFAMVWEGQKWFDGTDVCVDINVTNDNIYSAAWYDQSDYLTMEFGEKGESWIEFINNGTMAWERMGASPLHLGTNRPMDRYSMFHDEETWLADNRIELDQADVQPGEVGRFSFNVMTRSKGSYSEYFRPVVEGVQWLPDDGVFLKYDVD